MQRMRCGVCRYWMPVGPHYLSLQWARHEQTCPACLARLTWMPNPFARLVISIVCMGVAIALGSAVGYWWDDYRELCGGNPLLAGLLAGCFGLGLIYLCLQGIGRIWPGKWTVRHTVRDDGTANMLHSRLAG